MTGPSGSNIDAGETDPFAQLHKMSTTAGAGSGDYIAINGSAIATILLGVSSAMVLFNGLYFLIIPVAAVFLGVMAFVQISRSNGTQTGREVAAIGLLLALGFGGFAASQAISTSVHDRADQKQVVSVVNRLGDLLKVKDYEAAYNLFDSEFKKRVSVNQFQASWVAMSSSPIVGSIESIDWNHLLSFEVDPVTSERIASGQMLIQANPKEKLRVSMSLRNEGG